MKYCEKFYELWRDDKLDQTTTDSSTLNVKRGDIILEYVLNSVKVVESYITREGEW